MSYMVCANPLVRIDIMVQQRFWPMLASSIQRCGCKYYKEDWVELSNGFSYVILRDVKADRPHSLGDMFRELHILEQEDQEGSGKFYILVKPRKRGRKHDQKDRKETGSGSNGGNEGEPRADEPGQDPGTGEGGNEPDISGSDNFRQLEMFEFTDEIAGVDNDHQ